MARRADRFVLYSGLCTAMLFACSCESKEAPRSEPEVAASPQDEVEAPAAATEEGPRCGDFLSTAEAKALGLDTEGYDEDATPRRPGMGVNCLAATLFRGDAYDTMIRGLHANLEKSGMTLQEGPTIGGASQWSSMGPMQAVMFHSTNKRFAATVSDPDKARVEKIARFLLAKMDKR